MENDKIVLVRSVLLFIVTFLLLFLFLNSVYSSYVLKKSFVFREQKMYEEYVSSLTEKRIKFGFFGDSHVKNSVNPQFIIDSFNFASSSENYLKSFYKLDKIYNQDKVNIETIFFEIDPHTFSGLLNDESMFIGDSLWYYSSLIPIEVISNISKKSQLSLFFESQFPVIGNGEHFTYLVRDSNFYMYKGWLKSEGDFSSSDKETLVDSAYIQLKNYERVNQVSLEYFQKTIKLADEKNSNIVFVKYPLTKDYQEMLDSNFNITDEGYYQIIFEKINETLKDYVVLDYSDLFLDNESYFSDSHHLNYIGAEHFSIKLQEDIIAINLTSNNSFNDKKLINLSNVQTKKKNFYYDYISLLSIAIIVIFLLTLLLINFSKQIKRIINQFYYGQKKR